jgi:hypothetical protein
MITFATPLIDGTALWKIVVAAFAGGAGVVIAFGILLLGVSRASKARSEIARLANYGLSALAGLFCIGAVAIGIYAMVKKPASPKPKPAKSAALVMPAPAGGPDLERHAAVGKPLDDAVRRIALPFGARGEPQGRLRRGVELVTPASQVQDHRHRDRHSGIIDLRIDQRGGFAHEPLEVVEHARHGLVVVLELEQQVAES